MALDFAKLAMIVETQSVRAAQGELSRLRQEAGQTERETKKLTQSSKGTDASVKALSESAGDAADNVSDYAENTDDAADATDDLDEAAASLTGTFLKVGGAVVGAVTGLLSLNQAKQTILGFESGLIGAARATSATVEEVEALRVAAQDLGQPFAGATAITDGFKALGDAGFDAKEAISELPTVMSFAYAAQTDLSSGARIAAESIKAFGLSAFETTDALDVITATSESTRGSIMGIAETMMAVGPAATVAGQSIRDTAAAVGVLADAGVTGERAASGLRQIFDNLIRPTREMERVMADLGISLDEINPRVNSIGEIMEVLSRKGLTASQAISLFGTEAGIVGRILLDNNREIRTLTEELQEVEGITSEVAARYKNEIGGAYADLKASIESLALALGDAGLTTAITSIINLTATLVDGVTAVVSVFAEWNAASIVLTSTLGALAASTVVGTIGMIGSAALKAAQAIGGLALGVRGAATGLAILGGPVGAAAGLFTAATLAAYGLGKALLDDGPQKTAAASLDDLNDSLEEYATTAAPKAGAAALDAATKIAAQAEATLAAAEAQAAAMSINANAATAMNNTGMNFFGDQQEEQAAEDLAAATAYLTEQQSKLTQAKATLMSTQELLIGLTMEGSDANREAAVSSLDWKANLELLDGKMQDLNSSVSDYARSVKLAATPTDDLQKKYGALATVLSKPLKLRAEIAKAEAVADARETAKAITDEFESALDAVGAIGVADDLFLGTLKMTNEEADKLRGILADLENASSAEQVTTSIGRLSGFMEETYGSAENIPPEMQKLLGFAIDAATRVAEIASGANQANSNIAGAAGSASQLAANLRQAVAAVDALAATNINLDVNIAGLEQMKAALERGASEAQAEAIGAVASKKEELATALASPVDGLRRNAQDKLREFEQKTLTESGLKTEVETLVDALNDTGSSASGSGSGGGIEKATKDADALRRSFDDLVGSMDPVYQKTLELKRATDTINEAMAAGVITAEEKTRAMDLLADAYENTNQAATDFARDASSALSSVFTGVRSLKDAVAQLALKWADLFLQKGFDQLFDSSGVTGALGGFFEMLGWNEKGTTFWKGGYSVVGEGGPEIVKLPMGAQVFSNEQSKEIVEDAMRFQTDAPLPEAVVADFVPGYRADPVERLTATEAAPATSPIQSTGISMDVPPQQPTAKAARQLGEPQQSAMRPQLTQEIAQPARQLGRSASQDPKITIDVSPRIELPTATTGGMGREPTFGQSRPERVQRDAPSHAALDGIARERETAPREGVANLTGGDRALTHSSTSAPSTLATSFESATKDLTSTIREITVDRSTTNEFVRESMVREQAFEPQIPAFDPVMVMQKAMMPPPQAPAPSRMDPKDMKLDVHNHVYLDRDEFVGGYMDSARGRQKTMHIVREEEINR